MRVSATGYCLLGLSTLMLGQTAVPPADIHASPASNRRDLSISYSRSGRLQVRGATMIDLLALAWELEPEAISGGPTWIASDRYDLLVKLQADREQAKPVLRDLLTARFGWLCTRRSGRPMSSWW